MTEDLTHLGLTALPDGSLHFSPGQGSDSTSLASPVVGFPLSCSREGRKSSSQCLLAGGAGDWFPHLSSLKNKHYFLCKTGGTISACVHGLTTLQQGVGLPGSPQPCECVPRAPAPTLLDSSSLMNFPAANRAITWRWRQENPTTFNPRSPKETHPFRASLLFYSSAPPSCAELQCAHPSHPALFLKLCQCHKASLSLPPKITAHDQPLASFTGQVMSSPALPQASGVRRLKAAETRACCLHTSLPSALCELETPASPLHSPTEQRFGSQSKTPPVGHFFCIPHLKARCEKVNCLFTKRIEQIPKTHIHRVNRGFEGILLDAT